MKVGAGEGVQGTFFFVGRRKLDMYLYVLWFYLISLVRAS